MSRRHLLPALVLLGYVAGAIGTEESARRFLRSQADVDAASLKNVNVLWETEGDLNGDGLADYAAIVTGRLNEGAREEERLVVLAGATDGTYKLISQSGEFCGVGRNGKFYELSIAENSLFVRGVWTAEGERYSGITMQFRYNRNINDLQLIGEEEESKEGGQDYKVSVNYLTGAVIYNREGGRRRREVKAHLTKASLFKLQDFECFSQNALKPNVYIDENFGVKRK